MDQPNEQPSAAHPAGCSHCRLRDDCPAEADAPRGWRLAVSAAAMFLLPLAFAAAGAVLCGPEQTWRWLGALGGLIVGLVVGVAIGRLTRGAKEGA